MGGTGKDEGRVETLEGFNGERDMKARRRGFVAAALSVAILGLVFLISPTTAGTTCEPATSLPQAPECPQEPCAPCTPVGPYASGAAAYAAALNVAAGYGCEYQVCELCGPYLSEIFYQVMCYTYGTSCDGSYLRNYYRFWGVSNPAQTNACPVGMGNAGSS
jgi:hypothetical protein